MTLSENEFWAMLERAHRAAAAPNMMNKRLSGTVSNAGLVLLRLEDQLTGLADFHRTLQAVHRRAYRRDVWTAFDLALGGLDEVAFAEAVSWLVLSGRTAYEAVLADPDNLAELAIDERDLYDAPGLDSLAGSVMPRDDGELSDEEMDELIAREEAERAFCFTEIIYFGPPPGDPLPADVAVLRARFPRLTDRHLPRALNRLPQALPSLAPA